MRSLRGGLEERLLVPLSGVSLSSLSLVKSLLELVQEFNIESDSGGGKPKKINTL